MSPRTLIAALLALACSLFGATTTQAATVPPQGQAQASAGHLQWLTQPTIEGGTSPGTTLTVTGPGTTNPATTSAEYQWRRDYVDITGATGDTYTITESDRGHYLHVTQTATLPGYETSTMQSREIYIPLPTNTNIVPPKIVGTLSSGRTLTVDTGQWDVTPTSFTYLWESNGGVSFGSTYALDEWDRGNEIRLVVTAYTDGYEPVEVAAAPVRIPRVFPDPDFGFDLSRTTVGAPVCLLDLFVDPATPERIAYQWLRDGTPITGATGKCYTLTSRDPGTVLALRVTLEATGYETKQATLTAGKIPDVFSVKHSPRISGTRAVGKTLTLDVGSYNATPSGYAIQWKRNGSAVPGAISNQYTLTAKDAGRYISATVTVSKSGFSPRTVSAAKVGVPIHNSARPTVAGTKRAGAILTARVGSWTPYPTTYTYRWYRSATPIAGATSRAYRLTRNDVGKRIRVKVTAKRTGYVSGFAYSASTSTITR